jgi:uncharacterized protein YjbI with pentapeptide repeats
MKALLLLLLVISWVGADSKNICVPGRGEKCNFAQLSGKRYKNQDFTQIQLNKADLEGIAFESVSLVGSQVSSSCLHASYLRNVEASAMTAQRSDFAFSIIQNTNFIGADFYGSDFSGTELYEVSFENANLRGANFYKSDLRGVNFSGAEVYGANFEDANLVGAIWVDGLRCVWGSIGFCKHYF